MGVIIWIPLLLRLLFLSKPFKVTLDKLAPHGGWALRRLRELPIRGFGMLIFNEVLGFGLPILLVVAFRFWADPLGWDNWSATPVAAIALLLILLIFWLLLDLYRIARIRRMLKAVNNQDVEKLRKIADTAFSVRGFLRRFGRKEVAAEEEDQSTPAGRIARGAAATWGLRALRARKFTPAGLVSAVAVSASVEIAKAGAGKVTEIVDQRLQEEFDKIKRANSKTIIHIFVRDLAMALFPLLAIAFAAYLF